MTNKQIKDGCPYQGECSLSGCKRNDDGCFIRQLFEERYRAENQIVNLNKTIKAKEQECEMLKIEAEKWESAFTLDTKMLDNAEVRANKLEQQLDQLKAENVKLKKWKEAVVELFERTCRCKYLNEENNHCGFYNRKCIGRLNQCLYKNQQALTEIKEIIKQGVKIHDDIIINKQILQKISESE